jgi:hypothetical protein
MGLLNEKPPAWLHLVVRAPIWLYRVGLGRLLGHRLVHIGRTTGRRRETVLDWPRADHRVLDVEETIKGRQHR